MSIPDYQACMGPLLRLAADETEHTVRGAVERLADQLGLDPAAQAELLTTLQTIDVMYPDG
jgi:restriction endonuclease Mrr